MSVADASKAQAQTIVQNELSSWPFTFAILAEDTASTGDDFIRVRTLVAMPDVAMLPDL